MSELEVRRARPEDYARVGELTVDAYTADGFLDNPGGGKYAAILRDTAARVEHAEVLVARDGNGALLGSVTVVLPDTEFAEVARAGEIEFRMLAVDPAARGRGVGEALTRAVVDRGRELGATRVVMSSMVEMATAHRLYGRLGFRRSPERDWSLTHISMYGFALELPAAR
ncbi:GNAT family N-acetyltransferase [Amycolatopsis antarctica]|uniref:GNAT family N-acetyltransferase n=1 Tax=Amycolatopsis antarctica TaxID=1854586 RepID=A0A263D7Q1_9PSEU|nr:GNAT family N-acetyltransferase [Amycolatopsis antarctica]OZM74038.1 GNAT family N-acetyltransferase [Amycolatopsis antarctica]